MATSKVYQGLVPILSTDYTEFLTLEPGISMLAFRLEQIDKNIWAWTLSGETQNTFPAHSVTKIATYDLTKLPPQTAHVLGFTVNGQSYYPQNIFFTATGDINVYNLSDINSTVFSANGFTYRRLS